jgi:tryptophanyl-tRNA synthetase
LRFLALFLAPDELAQWEARVREGGAGAPGYGHMKQRLIQAIETTFAPARARRAELLANPAAVDRVLAEGGLRARERARATVDRCYRAVGLR